jgi:hypothetical protein
MDRRALLNTVALGVLAAPSTTDAQSGRNPHIGYVWSGMPGSDPIETKALRQGLGELGYVGGHNLVI